MSDIRLYIIRYHHQPIDDSQSTPPAPPSSMVETPGRQILRVPSTPRTPRTPGGTKQNGDRFFPVIKDKTATDPEVYLLYQLLIGV